MAERMNYQDYRLLLIERLERRLSDTGNDSNVGALLDLSHDPDRRPLYWRDVDTMEAAARAVCAVAGGMLANYWHCPVSEREPWAEASKAAWDNAQLQLAAILDHLQYEALKRLGGGE